MSIVSVKSDNESITASFDANNSNPEIHVALGAGVSGTVKSKVIVTTNHPDPEQREIVLPIYGIISRKGG